MRLEEGRQLEVVVSEGEVRLRPAAIVPAEDAWAHTAENVAAIREALAQVSAGKVFPSTARDLESRVQRIKRRRRR
jgi:mRNA-degrading endonuclease YafQ of YafQ-DinJ toxin-antitoxin module